LRKVVLDTVSLPDFGNLTSEIRIPREEYTHRVSLARGAMAGRSIDALVVYGDREHSANIAYLCGYDPRFEESLLVLRKDGVPVLMVGNEGWGYADETLQIDVEKVLVQFLSLVGTPRESMKEPAVFLREAGIRSDMRVGVVGWKYFTPADFNNPSSAIEIPSYLVDALREIVRPNGVLLNANDLFMHPEHGLRALNDVDQVAEFEFAATIASQGVREMFDRLKPGMTEFEAVRLMGLNGMPLSCHVMCSTGPRVRSGLASPSMRVIQRGDPLTVALGLRGSLICRQGYVVEGQDDLAHIQPGYLEEVCIPYFALVVHWYESVGIGVSGGEVQEKVDATGISLALNPGHLIHLDEWVSTPFYKGSKDTLRSGMALQADMIPKMSSDKFGNNLEDTVVLADKALRDNLRTQYPETCKRIERRRKFMQDSLHIKIKPEVLPLSNYPAVLRPFLLNSRCLKVA